MSKVFEDDDPDRVIKQGILELQVKSVGVKKTFVSRYIVIKKNGVVDLYKKADKQDKKDTFCLQGGEEIIGARPKFDRFRFKILIPASGKGKKPQKYVFGCENESKKTEWSAIFQGVLKHLNCLAKLTATYASADAQTMNGQLKIAHALSDCGQLSKAKRIYSRLISKYSTEEEVHVQNEIFLSQYCMDIHQAEMSFITRHKFFCVPKTLLKTSYGTSLKKYANKISFLSDRKNALLSNNTNNDMKNQIAYIDIEKNWDDVLYEVEAKYLKRCRVIVNDYLLDNNMKLQYEYSYQDIEQYAFYLMKQCVRNKRGATRLVARLEAVADMEFQKKFDSEKYAVQFENSKPNGDVVKDVEDSKAETKINDNLSPENSKSSMAAQLSRSFVSMPSVVSQRVMDDVMDALLLLDSSSDEDDDNKSKKPDLTPQQSYDKLETINEKMTKTKTDFAIDATVEDIDDDLAFLGLETAFSDSIHSDSDYDDNLGKSKQNDDYKSKIDIDSFLDDADNLASSSNGGYRSRTETNQWDADGMTHIFNAAHDILQKKVHHIYPWSAFMLIWTMRRDRMAHIGNQQSHYVQLECVLEFVYLFTKGCMHELDSYWVYALLLCTLYNLSSDNDKEDVKFKMALSAVKVVGLKDVPLRNKKAVFRFMEAHNWLKSIKDQSKVLAMRKFFINGCKHELLRIQVALNKFYEQFVFNDKLYNELALISDEKNLVSTITSQTAIEVQAKATWGPRQENTYDPTAFALVCQHRDIQPVPKPTRNDKNFDEAYMLFCCEMAKKLNPYFQHQIQHVLKKVECKHYDACLRGAADCYEMLIRQLSKVHPPKAAKILDYCRCVVTFRNIKLLVLGFQTMEKDKRVRICKIINFFQKKKAHHWLNLKYINVYILCKHPTNKHIKLICECRLMLQECRNLHDEREIVNKSYGIVLQESEIKSFTKEISKENPLFKKETGLLKPKMVLKPFHTV